MGSSASGTEVYCIECGEQIKRQAEICPECGVRQPVDGNGTGASLNASQQRTTTTGQDNIGIIYAHIDAQQRKKTLRNLFDLGLALVSVGFYLGVMLVEGMRHYYKLKRGQREPYDANRHEKVWIV